MCVEKDGCDGKVTAVRRKTEFYGYSHLMHAQFESDSSEALHCSGTHFTVVTGASKSAQSYTYVYLELNYNNFTV